MTRLTPRTAPSDIASTDSCAWPYEAGDDWLVEVLEPQRESVAAQAAFGLAVLEDYEARRKTSGNS